SRNDQVATDLALWIRESAAPGIAERLNDLIRAFIELADRSVGVVLPSFTHLQRAQPIAAGAESLAWATMFDRDDTRIVELIQDPKSFLEEYDDIPLGSGAIAGTSLPIDPNLSAQLLEFRRPPMSSIEATASRDRACDLLFCLSMISQHLSRWAEQ